MDGIMTKTTGAGLDAMLAMLPHVDNIINDPEFIQIKQKIKGNENLTFGEMIKDTFPMIVQKKRDSLYGIVSAVTGKTAAEIEKQPLQDTISVFTGAMGGDVISFFIYSARLVNRL